MDWMFLYSVIFVHVLSYVAFEEGSCTAADHKFNCVRTPTYGLQKNK